jgi:hypothetical protein
VITRVGVLPWHPQIADYEGQAKDLLRAWTGGDSAARERVRTFHPLRPSVLNLADARLTVAREYGFEGWAEFVDHLEALADEGSAVARFERAADAIVAGEADTLERLLRENPELVKARSTRIHHGTLLHYVGANGVEDYRQKTPENATAILGLLLKAGAAVDAEAEMYHIDTTLGLVATSIHPLVAGVQQELMEALLAAGAAADSKMITACLANGRGRAAEFLAARVEDLDLEAAAGIGRMEVLRACFNGGALRNGATRGQLEAGLNWAAEYGRDDALEFLLAHGADPAAADRFGMTALHWAAVGGQAEAARILLEHGAPLEAKSGYGGTPLGQAIWSALHDQMGIDYVPVVEVLLAAGADAGEIATPTGHAGIDEALGRHRAQR